MTFRFKNILVPLFVIWVFLFSFGVTCASAQQARTLAGEIALDVGVAPKNLAIDVIVNNHSLVVLPPPFGIIRPITSTQVRRIAIREGEVSAPYFVDDILTDRPPLVDYTVGIQCINCSDVFRTQYYAPSGNRFGFANQVYLDPDSLGTILNFGIITDLRLSGEIKLGDGAVADRSLNYIISISEPTNENIVYLRSSNIVLLEGQNSVSYQLTGLSRQIGSGEFSISALCTNCFANSAKPQFFSQTLSTSQNHSNIDFSVVDRPPLVVSPMLKILLY